MINEQAARTLAATKGINVGTRQVSGTVTTIQVGSRKVFHTGSGGAGCWQIEGYVFTEGFHAGKPRTGYVGAMIATAVEMEAGR
jgi:hypothetical protein